MKYFILSALVVLSAVFIMNATFTNNTNNLDDDITIVEQNARTAGPLIANLQTAYDQGDYVQAFDLSIKSAQWCIKHPRAVSAAARIRNAAMQGKLNQVQIYRLTIIYNQYL